MRAVMGHSVIGSGATVICTIVTCTMLASSAGTNATEIRGVTATDIKIGQTMPYSGPVSAIDCFAKLRLQRARQWCPVVMGPGLRRGDTYILAAIAPNP